MNATVSAQEGPSTTEITCRTGTYYTEAEMLHIFEVADEQGVASELCYTDAPGWRGRRSTGRWPETQKKPPPAEASGG